MAYTIDLPIRQLAEFLERSGSLDSGLGGLSFERAAEGSRIHRQMQAQAGEGYKAEVPLSLTLFTDGFEYVLHGRADGIFENTLDEIKSTAMPYELIVEDMQPAHWAQAQCYAYIYALQSELSAMRVQLTYVQVETLETKSFVREFSLEALERYVYGLLARYRRWAEFTRDWENERDQSLKALTFPFPAYRSGQRRLAGAVYRALKDGSRLFAQAPTGTGKTLSVLFPALKAMGEGGFRRIFYLTAKTVTRQAAQDALQLMRERSGLRLKSLTLTAKEKICFTHGQDCANCSYAAQYYARSEDACYALLTSQDHAGREQIEAVAREHTVCPFELSLDLSLWCDCIVCDYNYLFDPVVYLRRFFDGGTPQSAFLVDEAHNLVSRAREMHTARLLKSDFLRVKKPLEKGELRRALNAANSTLIALRKEATQNQTGVYAQLPQALLTALRRVQSACTDWLPAHEGHPSHEDVLLLFFQVRFFLRIAELFDHRFVFTVSPRGSDVALALLCLDPSALVDKALGRGCGAVFFSATLSPIRYYMDTLGGAQNAKGCLLPSPFPKENLGVYCADDIPLRYAHRQGSVDAVCAMLYAFITAKQGNYIAYFPSYQYMADVYTAFAQRYPTVACLVQSAGMSEEEREAFVGAFSTENSQTLLGFCVLGGIFSEGIDLIGERLIGVAVVGVGLPAVSAEQELLRDYYQTQSGAGFDFAYRFPGIGKVTQAAGRVIRTEQDRGVVLLIDSRFREPAYRNLLPEHWSPVQAVKAPEALKDALYAFWKEN